MFNYKGLDRVPTFYTDLEEVIGKNKGHIIGSSACVGGFVGKNILREDYEAVDGFIEWCHEVFGKDNFYLELQPHKKASFMEEYSDMPYNIFEQEIVNKWIKESGHQAIITTSRPPLLYISSSSSDLRNDSCKKRSSSFK